MEGLTKAFTGAVQGAQQLLAGNKAQPKQPFNYPSQAQQEINTKKAQQKAQALNKVLTTANAIQEKRNKNA